MRGGKEGGEEGDVEREKNKLGKVSRMCLYAIVASSRGVGKGA